MISLQYFGQLKILAQHCEVKYPLRIPRPEGE